MVFNHGNEGTQAQGTSLCDGEGENELSHWTISVIIFDSVMNQYGCIENYLSDNSATESKWKSDSEFLTWIRVIEIIFLSFSNIIWFDSKNDFQ
jgi:hypothetical protein